MAVENRQKSADEKNNEQQKEASTLNRFTYDTYHPRQYPTMKRCRENVNIETEKSENTMPDLVPRL